MKRKLFCEICPLTYALSVKKCEALRFMKDIKDKHTFAHEHSEEKLEYVIYKHNSLIRRRLGNVNMQLQENKAVNLSLAAPKVNGIIIRPGEHFLFWNSVGFHIEKNDH